jgi:hypothetical protein
MGGVTAFEVIDRLTELDCAVRVEDAPGWWGNHGSCCREKLKVRGPNVPEVAELVSALRARRDNALAIPPQGGDQSA